MKASCKLSLSHERMMFSGLLLTELIVSYSSQDGTTRRVVHMCELCKKADQNCDSNSDDFDKDGRGFQVEDFLLVCSKDR